jgi:DNA-binding MarR family transcriptional regulator
MTQETEQKAGLKFDRLLDQVRTAIDPTVPTQLVQAFVKVALYEGKTLTEYADMLGANVSTASRHLLDLGERNRKMEPGYQLVESRNDPMNLRQKHYSLTRKGQMLWRALTTILED